MNAPTPAQIRQWTEELARDPGSRVFLPLAEAHWRAGRTEVALRLCLRGLERYPDDVAAHVLLGRLYAAHGDLERAMDEWSIAVQLDPDHVEAHRELGRAWLARGQPERARPHLERIGEALPAPVSDGARSPTSDPVAAWEAALAALVAQGVLGAVVIDEQGLVVAGRVVVEGIDLAEALAAAFHGLGDDAERACRYLGLGDWSGATLELARAHVRVLPLGRGSLAVATAPTVPLGRAIRLAERLQRAAGPLVGEPA